ncbi:MAG: hypothetical protein RL582_1033 [Bacteroidota bacterium]|jgi:hypothetical protein
MKTIKFTISSLAIILISFGAYAQSNIFETTTITHKTCSVSYGKYDTAKKNYVYFETRPDTICLYSVDERLLKTPSNSYHTFKGAKNDFITNTDSVKVAYEELQDAFGEKCKMIVTVKYLNNKPIASNWDFEYKTHAFRYNLIMPKLD